MKSKHCNKCGAEVYTDEKYCFKCGNLLETGNTCNECGATLKEGATFCSICGCRVKPGHESREEQPKGRLASKIKRIVSAIACLIIAFILFFVVVSFVSNHKSQKIADYKQSSAESTVIDEDKNAEEKLNKKLKVEIQDAQLVMYLPKEFTEYQDPAGNRPPGEKLYKNGKGDVVVSIIPQKMDNAMDIANLEEYAKTYISTANQLKQVKKELERSVESHNKVPGIMESHITNDDHYVTSYYTENNGNAVFLFVYYHDENAYNQNKVTVNKIIANISKMKQ